MNETDNTRLENWVVGGIQPRPRSLPDKWRLVRLTDVAKLESGHTPSRRRPTYWNGGVPWVSLNDVDELDANEILQTKETISDLGLANSSARLLPTGTVIFSRTASIGKSTILGLPMSTTQDFANYICGPELHNRYLMYLFRYMKGTWKRLMAGSTHNTIYMPIFKGLQILLPPAEEQRAIAAALSDADEWIASLDRLIAKKRDIKQATMQQLLTGKTRLPGFQKKPGYKQTDIGSVPEDWEVETISNIGKVVRGGSPRPAGDPRFFGGGYIPWLTVAALTNIPDEQLRVTGASGYLTEEGAKRSRTIFSDTVIIANSGATLGVAKLLSFKCCANDGIAVIVAQKKGVKEFICYYINSITDSLRKVVATGNGQPN